MVTLQKYNQAKFEIMALIANMNLQIGDKLPPEREITTKSKFSIITCRHALKEMEKQGIIERRPRLGTFLKKTIENDNRDHILFIHSFRDKNRETPLPPKFYYELNDSLTKHFVSCRFYAAGKPDASFAEVAQDCVAVLIQGWITEEWVDFLKTLSKPSLVIGANPFPGELSTVTYDWKNATKDLTAHFISRGFKNIGLINGGKGYYPAERIYLGYAEAMNDAEIKVNEELVIWPGHDRMHEHIYNYMDHNSCCDALILESGALGAFLQCAWNRKYKFDLALGMIGDSPQTQDFYNHINHAVIATFEQPLCELAIQKVFAILANDSTKLSLDYIKSTLHIK